MSVKPAARFNFTKKAIEALPIPHDKRATCHDTQTRGLGLLVQPSGHRAFFWFRKVNGYPTWQTIGPFPDLTVDEARTRAAEHNAKLARWKADNYDGDDPFSRRTGGLTLETLITEYVEHHVKSHAANPERAVPETTNMSAYFPGLKGRRLGAIRSSDIRNLHKHLGEQRGHVIANRVMEFIRRVYNWALETERWSGLNPADNIKKFHEEKRTRYLQREEAGRLLRALRSEFHADLRDFVLLALMTGARKRDILSMRWADLYLDANRWEVPRPKARKPYNVPLMPKAVEVLAKRLARRTENSPWVFPTPKSKSKKPHLQSIKKPWQRLRKAVQIPDVTIHDLRRTLGSWQAERNVSLRIIGESLGHRSQGSTEIYSRIQTLDPVRDAVSVATRAMLAEAKKKPKLKLVKVSRG